MAWRGAARRPSSTYLNISPAQARRYGAPRVVPERYPRGTAVFARYSDDGGFRNGTKYPPSAGLISGPGRASHRNPLSAGKAFLFSNFPAARVMLLASLRLVPYGRILWRTKSSFLFSRSRSETPMDHQVGAIQRPWTWTCRWSSRRLCCSAFAFRFSLSSVQIKVWQVAKLWAVLQMWAGHSLHPDIIVACLSRVHPEYMLCVIESALPFVYCDCLGLLCAEKTVYWRVG